ncbi:MAG: hypothetical protein C5B58_05005 [Acidobacteria bacterium]|nr:MAG: hypothetical protein C5B58_05005 [Acidobacteriota bacterium]
MTVFHQAISLKITSRRVLSVIGIYRQRTHCRVTIQGMNTEDQAAREHLSKRLGHYRAFVFRWQPYKAPSPSWNHDHCDGCSVRFAERPAEWNDQVHTEGWVTLWPVKKTAEEESEVVAKWRTAGQVLVPSPKRSGFQLNWLCPNCFEACRQELEFVVDPEHPQWQKTGL